MREGWEKVARVAAVVGVVLFALYVIGTWEHDKPAPEVALEVPNALQGVRLGDKLTALTSSHGAFDKQPMGPDRVKKYADEEDYVQRNGQLRLGVRSGVVWSVAYGCREGRDRTALNNVACQAGPDRIKAVFGDRVRILCVKMKANDPDKELASSVRAYDAVEYATRYIVIKDSVVGFMVYQPGELETLVGINWEKCPGKSAAAR